MRLTNYFHAIILLFLLISCSKQEPKDILMDITLKTGALQSVYFKATEKYFYSNQPDTTITRYEVWAKRDKTDSLRNGFVWVDNHYRPYNTFYEQGTFYLAIPPKKTTVSYPDYTEDFISPIDWIDIFLKPEKLQKLTESGSTVISNIEYKGEPCTKISIQLSKDQSNKEIKQTYIISKKKQFPVFSEIVVKDKGVTYTNKLSFKDVIFDQVDINELKERKKTILALNPLEPEGAESDVALAERMLHIGAKAPLFKGKYYGSDKTFELSELIGKKVILLDFWYTHCPPCVRAMPAISNLYSKYKDKGLMVYGLNSVDNQPRSLKNLDHFLRKRKLSYEVLLTQPEVDNAYKIKGYPSMYVIDKNGRISYVEVGYDEAKFEELIRHIESLINP